MLQITCKGTPYEIGYTHGSSAPTQIPSTIAFYTAQFLSSCSLSWPQARTLAQKSLPYLEKNFPDLLEEMRGVADGVNAAGGKLLEEGTTRSVEFEDILAVNCRTEVMFGAFSPTAPPTDGTPPTNGTNGHPTGHPHNLNTISTDGCTSLSWQTTSHSYLAQNWDWMTQQKPNLIALTLHPLAPKPKITLVTEAGLIGKIGLNSAGVGVCLNALRRRGVNWDALPCHLALRVVLEASSRKAAEARIEKAGGVASACHFLIADEGTGGVGLEFCSERVEAGRCEMDGRGVVVHANHYLVGSEKEVPEESFFKDSPFRMGRMVELDGELAEKKGRGGAGPSLEEVGALFKDEKNWPGAICRSQVEPSTAATLFNIVMELKEKRAVVKIGRPSEPDEEVVFSF